MTRSIVFKTPGKLDLRSLTTFGLNAKPATGHPIGFFGTGLKYAIAVLAREKIPVTIFINGKKWRVVRAASQFRQKSFEQLYLLRETMIPKKIDLPYTTELGKTWKLWQAFRELETNTRDEKGSTILVQDTSDNLLIQDLEAQKCTLIRVEGEAFVQEYLDRDKTFLPEGLTLREGNEDIQIFNRPSTCVYYRGIRILDLDEKERGELTYNILRTIELTEDRTAKSKWDVQYHISQAISSHTDPEVIQTAVTAPPESFEHHLNFSYGVPSTEFLDTIAKIPSNQLDPTSRQVLKTYRPPKVKATKTFDYFEPLIVAIRDGNWDDVESCIQPYREEVIQALREAQRLWQKERDNNAPAEETQETGDSSEVSLSVSTGSIAQPTVSYSGDSDDIPF